MECAFFFIRRWDFKLKITKWSLSGEWWKYSAYVQQNTMQLFKRMNHRIPLKDTQESAINWCPRGDRLGGCGTGKKTGKQEKHTGKPLYTLLLLLILVPHVCITYSN